MQGGGRGVMAFGKSKAKMVSKDTPKTTFSDVAGADEAILVLSPITERSIRSMGEVLALLH